MSALADVQILVTGVTGFLGSRLAEVLATTGHATVTGTGRRLERVAYLRDCGVTLHAEDLRNTDALQRVVEGKQVIVHAAAVLDADTDTAQRVNVDATEALVDCAGKAGVSRFVHVSTVGVYDMLNLQTVNESAPLALRHPSTYPRTKAQAEERAIARAAAHGMALSIVRPSMIYGPGHGIWSTGMFQNIVGGKPVFLGDGSSHFHPVYIDDVVDAIIKCATHPDAVGEAFNISADVTTWREFMGHYGKTCGKTPKGVPVAIARLMAFANRIPGVTTPIDQGFIEMATARKEISTEKAAAVLGWRPQVSLADGLARTTRWLAREILGKG